MLYLTTPFYMSIYVLYIQYEYNSTFLIYNMGSIERYTMYIHTVPIRHLMFKANFSMTSKN